MARTARFHACLLLVIVVCCTASAQEPKEYLEYRTYKAWAALVPNLSGVRLCNLTKEGHRLWQTNQLRLPASTVPHGDLSGTGRVDWAIELAAASDDRCNYLLIATQQGRAWKQLFLHESHGLTPIWNTYAAAVGFDSGLRKEYSSPATMTWPRTEGGSKDGYLIIKRLVFEVIRWNVEKQVYEYEKYPTPEQWE